MNVHRYRRLLLFLLVLILPSLAILVLSWQNDEQALRLARTAFDKELNAELDRLVREIDQAMSARLEVIRSREILKSRALVLQQDDSPVPPAGFLGWIQGDRLVWPWNSEGSTTSLSPADHTFDQLMTEAARIEFADNERAAQLYRDLTAVAEGDRQRALARLGLARALRNSGAVEDSRSTYLEVLNLPWNAEDERGLPLASYAALGLTKLNGGRDVVERLKRGLELRKPATLDQLYRLQLILDGLGKSDDHSVREYAANPLEIVSNQIRNLEAAAQMPELAAVQQDFQGLGVTDVQWVSYSGPADTLWLISRATMTRENSPSLVLMIPAEPLRNIVELGRVARSDGPRFEIVKGGSEGRPLSDRFPDLNVVFSRVRTFENAALPSTQLYSPWLIVVVPLTFFGGYLLWRDTRRETRIAELRSQFVSSVSHELKTPLTSIRMFAETLLIADSTDRSTHDEYLETIVNESERLTRLLNNVLDASRIERGQKAYVMEHTQLEDVVHAAVMTMQYPLSEKGFVLEVNVCSNIPPVEADRDALQQAILNLLTNAMKYSGKCRDIQLRVFSQNGYATIQVTDHGIGIPQKEQGRIFEKFYRAHVPENRVIAGTGLGLALVTHIAEAHGGSVHVDSTPGSGSTFSIRIPTIGKNQS